MTTKRHECPTCGGRSTWDATFHYISPDPLASLEPAWECRNCHRVMRRRVLKRKPNPQVERALRNLGYNPDGDDEATR